MNFVKQDLLLLNHLIRKSSGGILAIKKEGIPSSLIAKNNKNYFFGFAFALAFAFGFALALAIALTSASFFFSITKRNMLI